MGNERRLAGRDYCELVVDLHRHDLASEPALGGGLNGTLVAAVGVLISLLTSQLEVPSSLLGQETHGLVDHEVLESVPHHPVQDRGVPVAGSSSQLFESLASGKRKKYVGDEVGHVGHALVASGNCDAGVASRDAHGNVPS